MSVEVVEQLRKQSAFMVLKGDLGDHQTALLTDCAEISQLSRGSLLAFFEIRVN